MSGAGKRCETSWDIVAWAWDSRHTGQHGRPEGPRFRAAPV